MSVAVAENVVAENVNDPFVVGEYVTVCHHSDRHAFEIVSRSAKKLVMRQLKAVLLNGMNSDAPDKLVANIGGFAAHVSGVQRYSYESNPDGAVKVAWMQKKPIRLVSGRDKECNPVYRYQAAFKSDGNPVIMGAHEHYDYNF